MEDKLKPGIVYAVCVLILSLLLTGLSGCGPSQEELRLSAIDHFKRGNEFFSQNDLNSAAEEYKRAIAQDSERAEFYFNLGIVYYSMFLYEKAIGEYRRAIELDPGFADAWYNLALALEKTDDTERAFMAYEKYKALRAENRKREKELKEQEKPRIIKAD